MAGKVPCMQTHRSERNKRFRMTPEFSCRETCTTFATPSCLRFLFPGLNLRTGCILFMGILFPPSSSKASTLDIPLCFLPIQFSWSGCASATSMLWNPAPYPIFWIDFSAILPVSSLMLYPSLLSSY